MTLNLDPLQAKVAIVTKDRLPTPQFQIFWQRSIKELQRADAALITLFQQGQQQQELIIQLLEVVAANVAYLNDLSDWLILMGQYQQQRIAYLQIAVADIATQGGYTIPDPSGLPVWPGPAPAPPF